METPHSSGTLFKALLIVAMTVIIAVSAVATIVFLRPQAWLAQMNAKHASMNPMDRVKAITASCKSDYSHFRQFMIDTDAEMKKEDTGGFVVSDSQNRPDFCGIMATHLPEGTEVSWSGTLTKVESKPNELVLTFADFESAVFKADRDPLRNLPAIKVFISVAGKPETKELWNKLNLPSAVAFKGKAKWTKVTSSQGNERDMFLAVKDAVPIVPDSTQK